MGIIYVAAPLAHEDSRIRNCRTDVVRQYAAWLWNKGQYAFSPIQHCEGLRKDSRVELFIRHGGAQHFREFDLLMMDVCSKMHVLQLPGWVKSVGVNMEIEKANRIKMPILQVEIPAICLALVDRKSLEVLVEKGV